MTKAYQKTITYLMNKAQQKNNNLRDDKGTAKKAMITYLMS